MRNRNLNVGTVALAAVLLIACDSGGDTIAPEGSQIVVSATPATVVVTEQASCSKILVDSCGTSEVVATVFSATGFPLEDQDVRFTTTAGALFNRDPASSDPCTIPATLVRISNEPIPTDGRGNARACLVTSQSTTVEARSGAATGSLTLNTTPGNIGGIVLVTDDPTKTGCEETSQDVTSCSQRICLKATIVDTSGQGIPGITITFDLINHQGGGGEFDGNFTPAAVTSNSDGEVTTTFTPNTVCGPNCTDNACDGSAQMIALAAGGIQSNLLDFNIDL